MWCVYSMCMCVGSGRSTPTTGRSTPGGINTPARVSGLVRPGSRLGKQGSNDEQGEWYSLN